MGRIFVAHRIITAKSTMFNRNNTKKYCEYIVVVNDAHKRRKTNERQFDISSVLWETNKTSFAGDRCEGKQ